MNYQEPQSWGELLKQVEFERRRPPPPEYYILQKQVPHPDGGIIPAPLPENHPLEDMEKQSLTIDPHFYTTTRIVDAAEENEDDDDEETKKLKYRRQHAKCRDHGFEITSWKIKTKREREFEDSNRVQTRNFPKSQMESGDYDIVSGVAHKSPYKNKIDQILKQREYAKTIEKQREYDPISNTFPSDCLEKERTLSDIQTRQNRINHHLSKMPPNERRAQTSALNIITGECRERNIMNVVNEFPNSDERRCRTALKREREIVENRENAERCRTAKCTNRFNNGRMKEIRNWNIINGTPTKVGWNENIKMKPSIWTWCQAEKLDLK